MGFKTEMTDINKTQNEMKGFQNVQKDMIETRNRIVSTKAELSRLKLELQKNPSDKLRTEVKRTSDNLGTLEDKLKSQIGRYSQLKTSLTSAGVNVKKLRQEYERLGKEFTNVEKKQNRYLKVQELSKMGEIDPMKVAKGFVLTAPVVGSVKLSLDDSTAFSDVKKQSGLAGKELEDFKYQILDATKHIPMMNDEIYALSAQALQSGVPIKEMSQFTSDAAMMATAFDIEAGEAAKTMATWRSAFGMTQPEVMKLADVVNYLGNNLATTPANITQVVNGVASLGKLAGVTEKQTAALAAQIMAQGKNADVTKTGLKNMFLTLASGSSATDRQQKAYKKLGLTSKEVAEGMQRDAEGTLFEVLQGVQVLDDVERASVLSDLFGKESIEIVAALNADVGKLKSVFTDINDETKYTNSALEEFNNKLEDPATQLDLAKKAMLQTGINAGNVLLPHVVTIAQKTGEFFNWISKIQKENPMLVKWFVLLGAGLVTINAAAGISKFLFGNLLSTGLKIYDNWGSITSAISKGKDMLPMLTSGFTKIFGLVSKMNFAMLMNPWVLAIGGVIAAGYLLIKNWDTVKEWFKSFVGYVGDLFKWLWEYSPLKMIIDGWSKVYNKIFGDKEAKITQESNQNIKTEAPPPPIPDLDAASNSLIASEEKIQNSTLNNAPQFIIHQNIEYKGDEKTMSPDLKRELQGANERSFEQAMKEYERKNKRLGFN